MLSAAQALEDWPVRVLMYRAGFASCPKPKADHRKYFRPPHRALAIADQRRSSLLPAVSTMVESGYPGFEAVGWAALFAPKDTPADIVSFLNKQVVGILESAEVQKVFKNRGAQPMPHSLPDAKTFIAAEVDKWGKAVNQSGASVD